MQEALKLGDRICVMKNGEIVQIDTPQEIIQNPANDFVRDFIGVKEYGENTFNIQDVIEPIAVKNIQRNQENTISFNDSLQTILQKLAHYECLDVEEKEEMIGVVTRASMLQYIAQDTLERGTYFLRC